MNIRYININAGDCPLQVWMLWGRASGACGSPCGYVVQSSLAKLWESTDWEGLVSMSAGGSSLLVFQRFTTPMSMRWTFFSSCSVIGIMIFTVCACGKLSFFVVILTSMLYLVPQYFSYCNNIDKNWILERTRTAEEPTECDWNQHHQCSNLCKCKNNKHNADCGTTVDRPSLKR